MINTAAVNQTKIGLTDYAWALVDELMAEHGCKSRSELLEWLVLCQRHGSRDAQALWSRRRQRGNRGLVVVVPDDCEIPPEG